MNKKERIALLLYSLLIFTHFTYVYALETRITDNIFLPGNKFEAKFISNGCYDFIAYKKNNELILFNLTDKKTMEFEFESNVLNFTFDSKKTKFMVFLDKYKSKKFDLDKNTNDGILDLGEYYESTDELYEFNLSDKKVVRNFIKNTQLLLKDVYQSNNITLTPNNQKTLYIAVLDLKNMLFLKPGKKINKISRSKTIRDWKFLDEYKIKIIFSDGSSQEHYYYVDKYLPYSRTTVRFIPHEGRLMFLGGPKLISVKGGSVTSYSSFKDGTDEYVCVTVRNKNMDEKKIFFDIQRKKKFIANFLNVTGKDSVAINIVRRGKKDGQIKKQILIFDNKKNELICRIKKDEACKILTFKNKEIIYNQHVNLFYYICGDFSNGDKKEKEELYFMGFKGDESRGCVIDLKRNNRKSIVRFKKCKEGRNIKYSSLFLPLEGIFLALAGDLKTPLFKFTGVMKAEVFIFRESLIFVYMLEDKVIRRKIWEKNTLCDWYYSPNKTYNMIILSINNSRIVRVKHNGKLVLIIKSNDSGLTFEILDGGLLVNSKVKNLFFNIQSIIKDGQFVFIIKSEDEKVVLHGKACFEIGFIPIDSKGGYFLSFVGQGPIPIRNLPKPPLIYFPQFKNIDSSIGISGEKPKSKIKQQKRKISPYNRDRKGFRKKRKYNNLNDLK